MIAYALATNIVLTVLSAAGAQPVVADAAVSAGQPIVIAVAGDGPTLVAQSAASADGKPRVVTVRRHGADSAEAATQSDHEAALKAEKEAQLAWQSASAASFPKYWIGVRLSQIPAPLAAHVGAKGAMILNVMKGSPADAEGIEQYDIVTAVDGKPIEGPMDLTAALRDRKAGDTVTLNIVRKAADRPVRLTLSERPADQDPAPKFEEPESGMEFSVGGGPVQFRGRALRMGPDGKWDLHDLGQLDDLNDMLKELQVHVFDGSGATWQGLKDLYSIAPDDEDKDVAINIIVNRDGNTTELKTDIDGKITVNRKNTDGSETTSTYDHLEALEAGDPAAAELYREHIRCDDPKVMLWHGKDGGMGKQFRIEVRRKMEHAMQEAEAQMADAQERTKQAIERLHEKMAEIHVEARSDDGTTSNSESFAVDQSADGSVSVLIIKGGKITEQYSFDSVDALKKSQPQIYERVKALIK